VNRRRGAVLATSDKATPAPDSGSGYRVERKTPRLAYGIVHAHVIYDSRLSFAARTLYSILCAHATTGDRTAWPGTVRLAELMGCSDKTRWTAQQELIEFGYLKITRIRDRGLKRGNIYTLTDDLPVDSFPHPREPRSVADDMPQRPEADDGSPEPRSVADDMPQRPETDYGSGDSDHQRPVADDGCDPSSATGHSDLKQTTDHEHPNRENKDAAGRVVPLRAMYQQRLQERTPDES
jgi:hypothetical protein